MDRQERRNERLLKAAEDGNLEKVKTLLLKSADINYKDKFAEFSALHCAASGGHSHVIQFLADNKADMNCRNKQRRTPLHIAVKHGHIDSARVLLENGTEVDATNIYGCTALHIAGYWIKSIEMADLLLTHGASVNIKDVNNITPVEIAAKSKNTDVLEFLKRYRDDNIQRYHDDNLSIQRELERFGLQHESDLDILFGRGSYKSHESRIYIVGPYDVGKTTIASMLMSEEMPTERVSTNGIWVHLRRAGINIDNREWVHFKPDVSKTSSVLEGFLLSINQSELAGENKDAEVLYQRVDNIETSSPAKRPRVETATGSSFEQPGSMECNSFKDIRDNAKMTRTEMYKRIKELVKSGNFKEKIAPVDIWDFGGQDVYYVTHQLFVCYRGTFILVFDGSKDLNETLPGTSYLPGLSDLPTTKVYLVHWVNSVLTYCKNIEIDYPKILIVATHRDKIKKENVEKRRRELSKELNQLFEGHSGKNHLLIEPLIFINATDKSDIEVKNLKSRIVEIAFSHPNWGDKMPIAWILLEIQIAMRVEKGEFILKKEELERINEMETDIPLQKRELKLFLNVQTALGKLIYFDDVKKLDEYIIINPLCFINILKSFVTIRQHWPNDTDLQKAQSEMSSKGILTKQILLQIWNQDDYKELLPYADYIIEILCHLDILIKHRRYDTEIEESSDKYLVPCMITTPFPQLEQYSESNGYCLTYNFEESIIPCGLSYRIISACLHMWDVKIETRPMVCAGCAVLKVDNDHKLFVSIGKKKIHIRVFNVNREVDRDVTTSIQECLTASIQRISRMLQSSSKFSWTNTTSFPFVIEVELQCGCLVNHETIKSCPNNNWDCTTHNSSTEIDKLLIWFPKTVRMIYSGILTERYCQALDSEHLRCCPTNKQLARLCRLLSFDACKELAIHIGLTYDQIQNTFDQFRYCDDFKFMLLWKWRINTQNATLLDIRTKLKEIHEDIRKVYQIFIEKTIFSEYEDLPLDERPDEALLKDLPSKIGLESFQLGIELGFDVPELEEIRYTHDRNIKDQTREILKRWSDRGAQTLRALLIALNNVERGKDCLLKFYRRT